MSKIKIFIEGGGGKGHKDLVIECQHAFQTLIGQIVQGENLLKIIPSGSRYEAFKKFCTALSNQEEALLLVDSEGPIDSKHRPNWPTAPVKQNAHQQMLVERKGRQKISDSWKPWAHLKNRKGDEWEKPPSATDQDCHLMVQMMEHWFLADPQALHESMSPGDRSRLKLGKLLTVQKPLTANDYDSSLESRSKDDVSKSLKAATSLIDPYGDGYKKGKHSFAALAKLNAKKLEEYSPWATRFFDELNRRLG